MARKQDKKIMFRSMREFERRYLPQLLAKKLAGRPKDAQALGASLANESLEAVKGHLSA